MSRRKQNRAPHGLTTKERLLFFSHRNHETGCWEWQSGKNQSGYGRVSYNRRLHSAHRVAYELFSGPIPEGLELDHRCGNRGCINPQHLEPVTHAENVSRGAAGKWLREKTHCPKGHAYSGDNLFIGRRGERRCRTCMRAQSAESNKKRPSSILNRHKYEIGR